MDLLNIMAEAALCTENWDTSLTRVFWLVGTLINIVRIVVPILLIVMGSLDLMKAVMASKDDEIKKAQSTLVKRAIVAVIVFFIPAIVNLLMGLVFDGYGEGKVDDYNCVECVLNPDNCPKRNK
ncbi:MAG: hypothetical protein IJO32_07460 [Bacilli bacterium]|nr:hypothetical protein [Bacilli bacterium]